MTSMNNIWVISDTHFMHENIKKLSCRPENYNELIVADWKSKVSEDDIVLHLGDVAWPEGWALLNELPGKKILIRGNHDSKSMFTLMNKGFDLVVESLVLRIEGYKLCFSHVPMIHHEYDINVCGHLHQNTDIVSDYPHYVISLEKQGYGVQNLAELFPKFKTAIKTWRSA